MNELVSIIVPIYNSEKTIKRCIDSILSQNYKHIEIILINDGSTDSSELICRKYHDTRIKFINQKNQGVSQARNTGIKNSQGKYICFVDADDYLDRNHIKIMYETLINDNSDMVITNFYQITKDKTYKNTQINNYCNCNIIECIYDIYSNCMLNQPWNKLFKRTKILHLFSKDMSLGEDLIFNIDYINQIKRISVINEYTYYYDLQQGLLHKQHQSIQEFLYLYWYMYNNLFIRINYHSSKFNLFFLKHYIRFLFENGYKINNNNYELYSKFCIENRIKTTKFVFYLLGFLYYIFKGDQ